MYLIMSGDGPVTPNRRQIWEKMSKLPINIFIFSYHIYSLDLSLLFVTFAKISLIRD